MRYRASNKYSFQEYYFRRDFRWRRIGSLWVVAAVFCIIGYLANSTNPGFWLAIFIGSTVVATTWYVGLLWGRAYFESRSIGTATWDNAPVGSEG